jgi:hypothetical protein
VVHSKYGPRQVDKNKYGPRQEQDRINTQLTCRAHIFSRRSTLGTRKLPRSVCLCENTGSCDIVRLVSISRWEAGSLERGETVYIVSAAYESVTWYTLDIMRVYFDCARSMGCEFGRRLEAYRCCVSCLSVEAIVFRKLMSRLWGRICTTFARSNFLLLLDNLLYFLRVCL